MTCLNALFAALKRPWRLAFPASDHKSRPTSGDGCHTAQTMRQMHWPDENALSTPYQRMPAPPAQTARAKRWAMVRHLDENSDRRRLVQQENEAELMLILSRGR